MPLNRATMFGGPRNIILATLTTEDLALAYDVEAQISSQFPNLAPSRAGDKIQLTLGGVDFVAASTGGYVIDADGVHDDALFTLNIDSSTNIYARGGAGGAGGLGFWDAELSQDFSGAGSAGANGGTAIRFGCETNIVGAGGLITKGYGAGGGGGGGATNIGTRGGGGGGGGGAALGTGGFGGASEPSGKEGVVGTIATNIANGVGGAAGGSAAGAGGNGGDSGGASVAGSAGTRAGGAAGSDGNAIDSQGFTHTIDGEITVTGTII